MVCPRRILGVDLFFKTKYTVYMMRKQQREMKMIDLNTTIIGNFGAMIPLYEGKVISRHVYDRGPTTAEIVVEWKNGATTTMLETEINTAPTPVTEITEIGYHTEDAYYG